MSLSNYTNLQTEIASYLARSDLNALIPDFIALAESKLNRVVRVRDMETTAAVTLSSGAGALPSDYLEWLSVVWAGTASGRTQNLRYAESDSESWRRSYRPNGDPSMFTIRGSTIRIRPVVDGTMALTYYASIPALVDNSTNWLLTRAPDVYLNYTMAEAFRYIRNFPAAEMYRAAGDEAVSLLLNDADSNKVSRRPANSMEAKAAVETQAANL